MTRYFFRLLPDLHRILLVLLLYFSSGCKSPAPAGDNIPYADLKQITAQFIRSAENESAGLIKLIADGKLNDTVQIQEPNWEAELASFQAYDLAHPVLQGRYRVDSVVSGNRVRICYTAVGDDLPLRQAVLVREGNKPVWLRMIDSTDNIMYHSRKALSLHLDSGVYQIDIEQHSWLFRSLEEHIAGQKQTGSRSGDQAILPSSAK